MPDRVYTKAEIEESKRQALMAFYRHRSEALRQNTTATEGVLSSSAQKPAAPQRPRRPGILGYIADRYQDATGQ